MKSYKTYWRIAHSRHIQTRYNANGRATLFFHIRA